MPQKFKIWFLPGKTVVRAKALWVKEVFVSQQYQNLAGDEVIGSKD